MKSNICVVLVMLLISLQMGLAFIATPKKETTKWQQSAILHQSIFMVF